MMGASDRFSMITNRTPETDPKARSPVTCQELHA